MTASTIRTTCKVIVVALKSRQRGVTGIVLRFARGERYAAVTENSCRCQGLSIPVVCLVSAIEAGVVLEIALRKRDKYEKESSRPEKHVLDQWQRF